MQYLVRQDCRGRKTARPIPLPTAAHSLFSGTDTIVGMNGTVGTSGQASTTHIRDAGPLGVWSRVWYHIFDKIFKIFEPVHRISHRYSWFPEACLVTIAASSGSALVALGITGNLPFTPLVFFIAAIACSFISLGAALRVALPLYIATYAALFVVVVARYIQTEAINTQRRTAFIIFGVLWVAFIPLITAMSYSFYTWVRTVSTRQNLQQQENNLQNQRNQQQQPPSSPSPSIALDQIPHRPLPVVVDGSHRIQAGIVVVQSRESSDPSPLYHIQDGFEEVREFV